MNSAYSHGSMLVMKISLIAITAMLISACAGTTDYAATEYKTIDRYNELVDSCDGTVRIIRFSAPPAKCLKFGCPPRPGDTFVCMGR